ncbi:MAG TPA: 50S ribosomal protein L25 [Syntrophorhabdales bacterium]|nr:50S ribosomal protein L25 [Syntrophorhabdales bacterium]
MEEIRLKAESRVQGGKNVARRLRREGVIPAILYGKDVEPLPLRVSAKEWRNLQGRVKSNTIIKMELKRNDHAEERPVMLKDLQRATLSDVVLHIDFLQVSMERAVQVEVPIHLVGDPVGVVKGGVIEQHLRSIMVESLPGQIPEKIDVDISALDIGDSVHVNEISLPGIKLLAPPDVAVVGVTPPQAEEKPAEAAAPAGEEAAVPAEEKEEKKEEKKEKEKEKA